jgi:hypothetical protein
MSGMDGKQSIEEVRGEGRSFYGDACLKISKFSQK